MVTPKLTFVYDRKGQSTNKKAATVELLISQGSKRKYISTGVRLFKKEWSNGSVVGRKDWKELNEQLYLIKKKCSEIIINMIEDETLELEAIPGLLKNKIEQQDRFIDYAKRIANRKYRSMSDGTKKHYQVLFRFLEDWGGIIYYSDVTDENILKMDDELVRRGLKESSRWNYHKRVKMFITKAVEDGMIKRNPYSHLDIKKGTEDGLCRYLTPKEFQRVEECKLSTESLRRVRDLFVFQTYTMMGYSDLAKFDFKKCIKDRGQIVYKAQRTKTKQEFVFVLIKPALNILKKYKYNLPIISAAKYNLYLKAVMLYANIDKPVTSHYARHTGATLLLNEGNVPIHIVQHILGHASIRETEKTYAKVLDKSIIESMVEFQNNIKKKPASVVSMVK